MLHVTDIDRALPYYRLVYGAQAEGPRDANGRVWIRLERNTRIGLQKVANGESPRIGHYAIKVARFDRGAVTARLQQISAKILPSPDEPDVLRFADDNGIVVELRAT
jgi:hypothetical protein